MAHAIDPPKKIGQLIDQVERIREELLTVQKSLEKIEQANISVSDGRKKVLK